MCGIVVKLIVLKYISPPAILFLRGLQLGMIAISSQILACFYTKIMGSNTSLRPLRDESKIKLLLTFSYESEGAEM